MYQYQNNILSIPAKLIYDVWNCTSYDNYKQMCKRGKLIRTKEGRGPGNEPYVSFYDLPQHIKDRCIAELGAPKETIVRNQLENFIFPDKEAISFFSSHRKPDGKPLSEDQQREKATNAMVLNAIQIVLKDRSALTKIFGRKQTNVWQNISDAVNAIDNNKWVHSLPGNARILQRKYNAYLKEGYQIFIHKSEGTSNATKIKGDIADFLLAQYCLPIKLSIPMVLFRYNEIREEKGWDTLTEAAVYNFFYKPENERIWTLARHGKESWNRKFGYTLTRQKDDWFPNCYWAIDGSKLDWIHFDDESTRKMSSSLKIDIMFDVYSEKILGWSFGFTENHIEHFKAIKMAVNEAGCKPYYLTYDNQGGHKMARMQELYSSIVATDGGTHHPNRAKRTHGPAELLFKNLQQQVINKFWFSDGQSVKVRRDDNRMNEDFIIENKDNLLTVTQLNSAWRLAVKKWNDGKHSKFGLSRNEVYQHEMPMREELSIWEIMDKMWINETKPITYKAHGLNMTVGNDDYQFEVYDANGNIDLEFRRKHIGNKFIVRYDPEFLDGYVQLCMKDNSDNIVHVANAEPKRKHQDVPVLMKEGDKAQWAKDYAVKDAEFSRDQQMIAELMQRTGITPQREMETQDLEIKMQRSLTKEERLKLESQEYDF
jgi:hypothetical protein